MAGAPHLRSEGRNLLTSFGAFCLLTFALGCGIMGGPATNVRGPNFHYNTAHTFCQEEIYTNFDSLFFPLLCILTIDFWGWVW